MPLKIDARQELLARATRAFADPSADFKAVFDKLAEELVHELCDSCLVVLLDEDGVTLHSDLIRARDPELEKLMARVMSARPPRVGEGITGKAIETKQGVLVGPADKQAVLASLPEEYRGHVDKLALSSALSVPIRGPTGVIGGLALTRISNKVAFDEEDLSFAQKLADHAGTALTVARAYQADREARRRADAVLTFLGRLNEVSAKMSSVLDREGIARLVVDNARELIHADHAAVAVPTEDGTALDLIAHAGLPQGLGEQLKRFPVDSPLGLAEVFRTGKPILSFEKDAYYQRFPNAASKNWDKPIQAMAAVPLMQAGKPIGAIAFSFSKPVTLDDSLDAFITDLARHTASALERARLYEAERRARREAEASMARMKLLSDASRLFAESQHDLQATLDAVSGKLVELVADSCAILLIAVDGHLDPATVRHRDAALTKDILKLLGETRLKVGETLLGQVAETGAPVVLPKVDVKKLPSYAHPDYRAFHDRIPMTSMIIVPLRVAGKTIGVLNLGRYGDSPAYADDDLTLALELSDRAALAVAAAQSLDAERKARANSERIQQHLERLNELTTEISHAATPEAVARAIVQRSHQLLDANVTVLVFADESNATLKLLDHSGLSAQRAENFRVFPQSAKTPVADCFRTGKPVVLPTPEAISAAYPDLIAPEDQRERHAIICWPLVAGAKTVGAIGYGFYSPVKLDETFQGFVGDLARQSALALERAALYDAEKAAVRTREEFLSVASHELRTPLTPIALKLQTLGKELGTDVAPERLKEHVDVMRRQLRKLTHLVNGLLDVTRINAGRLALDRREVNVAELVREVVLRHEGEAASAGCTLYMEVPEKVVGDFDPMRVEQVTTNLLSNALKYGAGHPVRVSLTESARNIQLVVDDEGVGIDAQDLPRLFGRFERARSGLSFAGLGLGLYITRQIVEAHGGLIRVESAPGKGSRFEVELPKVKA